MNDEPKAPNEFRTWLRSLMKDNSLTGRDLAQELSMSEATFSRRLNGRICFTPDELHKLDLALAARGLLKAPGEVLYRGNPLPPPGPFWAQPALDIDELHHELAVIDELAADPDADPGLVGSLVARALVRLPDTRWSRKGRIQLRLRGLSARADRRGAQAADIAEALDLKTRVNRLADAQLCYEYHGSVAHLAIGADQFERALDHQRRALPYTSDLENGDMERADTRLAIANSLSYVDPTAPEAWNIVEQLDDELRVDGYTHARWPTAAAGPSYLDVMLTRMNLQLEVARLAAPARRAPLLVAAAETGERIMGGFYPSRYIDDNVTSLLCVAEVHALDGQAEPMESQLDEVAAYLARPSMGWYAGEVDRVVGLLPV